MDTERGRYISRCLGRDVAWLAIQAHRAGFLSGVEERDLLLKSRDSRVARVAARAAASLSAAPRSAWPRSPLLSIAVRRRSPHDERRQTTTACRRRRSSAHRALLVRLASTGRATRGRRRAAIWCRTKTPTLGAGRACCRRYTHDFARRSGLGADRRACDCGKFRRTCPTAESARSACSGFGSTQYRTGVRRCFAGVRFVQEASSLPAAKPTFGPSTVLGHKSIKGHVVISKELGRHPQPLRS